MMLVSPELCMVLLESDVFDIGLRLESSEDGACLVPGAVDGDEFGWFFFELGNCYGVFVGIEDIGFLLKFW